MTAAKLDAPTGFFDRLSVLRSVSFAWAVAAALWTIGQIVQTVINCLPGAHVMLDVPISQNFPPRSGSLSYGGSAYVLQHTSVTFTRASMIVSHLPVQNAVLIGLGSVFGAATSAGIAWCIFLLVQRLRANQPFSAATSRALVAAGIILAVGSSASSVSTSLGQLGLVIAYIGKYPGWPTFTGSDPLINFVPLFLAAVLFALAGVFRYGARLERERDELQRETAGLV